MGKDAVTITDPVPERWKRPGAPWSLFLPLIRDERDLPFVRLALLLTLLFAPMTAVLFYPGAFRWWMAPIYWVAVVWFLGPYVLMLHNTSHRILFKRKYRLLNKYIPWVVGPFFGVSPETYYAHHIGMHHQEDNLPKDLSSTMKYQRDSFLHFLHYYLAFLAAYPFITRYFIQTKRMSMLRRFWVGEIAYFAVGAAALWWNWEAAIVVFVVPVFFTRLSLMAGNWGQHAFIDHDDPTNDYCTVTSFINSQYNHRCFNDGYHLGHHLKASRHWLEMPDDFLAKKDEMIRHRTVVFRGLDYFMISVALFLKQYRWLARRFVNLDPDNPLSEDEVVALLKDRLRRFESHELEALSAPSGQAAQAA